MRGILEQNEVLANDSAPGRGQLYFGGKLVGNAKFDVTVEIIFGIEGLSCGYDFGEAMTHDYHVPFRFTGTIHKVAVDVSGELIKDKEAEMNYFLLYVPINCPSAKMCPSIARTNSFFVAFALSCSSASSA
jgi:hypothetical protein